MKYARLLAIVLLSALMIFMLYRLRMTVTVANLLSRERPIATQKLSYGTLPDQYGELWLPEGKGQYPVVIMIHGGCWREDMPSIGLMTYIAEDLRRSGVAVWNIEYRRVGGSGGYPGTFLDVASGVDKLRQIAPTNGLNLSHVIVLGHSAGGHLALWAAGRGRIKPRSPLYRKRPLRVQAAVSLAGIGDLAAFRTEGSACGGSAAAVDAIAGRSAQKGYADTSPAALLPLHVPQLIVSGKRDKVVPSRYGEAYAALARAAGDKADVLDIKGAGHFELIDPEADAWKQIKPAVLNYLK